MSNTSYCSCSAIDSPYTPDELTSLMKEFSAGIASSPELAEYFDSAKDMPDEYVFRDMYGDSLYSSLAFPDDDAEGYHHNHELLAIFLSLILSKKAMVELLFEGDAYDECWGYEIRRGKILHMEKKWVTVRERPDLEDKVGIELKPDLFNYRLYLLFDNLGRKEDGRNRRSKKAKSGRNKRGSGV